MYDKSKEKIEVTLPDSLISEVDSIVQMENSNREDFAKSCFSVLYNSEKENSY
ncbi:hypothetical protein I5708_017880 [Clostridioides difficile]